MLTTTKEMLLKAQDGHYAVGAFNVENLEFVMAVIAAAEERHSPVIMQTTPGTVKYASLDYFDSDLPPMYSLEGVDLSTEGAITISRVLDYAGEYLSGTQLHPRWEGKRDGAARIARLLFENATDIHFFVGCAMNPAHQNPNLSLAFGAKFQLIEKLAKRLEEMGKRVTVRFF